MFCEGLGARRLGLLYDFRNKIERKYRREIHSRVDTGVVIDWQRVLEAFAKESKKFSELSMTNPWEEVRNKNFIVDFVYLALIVFLEPLRLVFGEVRIIDHDDPSKDGNIYIRPTRTLVLRMAFDQRPCSWSVVYLGRLLGPARIFSRHERREAPLELFASKPGVPLHARACRLGILIYEIYILI